MPRPSANIHLSNGNLGGQAPSEYGTAGVVIASPVAPVAGYLVPFLLKSAKQAATAFAQTENLAVLTAIVDGFFAEAPVGSKLYVLCAAPTNTLAQMSGNSMAGALLSFGNGEIRLMSAIKFPSNLYTATMSEGFDQDVHNAVSLWHTLAVNWFAARKPFRSLLQGFAFTGVAADAKTYAAQNKNTVGIVIGAINDSTATATLIALGRAAKSEPQRNIGRVKSGSLNIADAATLKIGSVLLEKYDTVDLDTLYDKRYIAFDRNESAPGYILSDDNMLTSLADDYSSLRHGRVIDNAVRIAYASYYEELKDDVEVDDNGRLAPVDEKALENKIEIAIDSIMRAQLSKSVDGSAAVNCLVNPDVEKYASLYAQNEIEAPNFNILETNKVFIFVSMRPKGCLKYIDIYLGYTQN